ncbi:MAG: SGNH/GDSL hydrolase family protein [Pseudolabrys sp.]
MRTFWALLALGVLAVPAWAEMPAECRVARHLVEDNLRLQRVGSAIAAKHLNVLVLGAGSSVLPGPGGANLAYPERLRLALIGTFPGVAVTVATDVTPHRTAVQMVESLAVDLRKSKPDLLVWQTGTVDAMDGVDQDQFNQALDKGINIAKVAGAETVLINAQYSPRTESMIALGNYAEIMRWVAVQHEVPLFDRFAIMKLWADFGTFDFFSVTKNLDTAGRVHDCIGRLLAALVADAVKPESPPIQGGQ